MMRMLLYFAVTATSLSAQTVLDLPVPVCSGTAETIGDSIYFFGGARSWSGSVRYQSVYKFDGFQWRYYDSIPDDNMWGTESAVTGTDVFIAGGWPAGARYFRKYDLLNKSWTYLNQSPNSAPYGNIIEYVNDRIYLINSNGEVYEYNFDNGTWETKTSNRIPAYSLSSAVYMNEIYLAGFYDSALYKYSPSSDEWTPLSVLPYLVSRCAMEIIDDRIYCAGGSRQGSPADQYNSLLIYDIQTNSWSVDKFSLESKKVWMADLIYNDKFIVLGGIDTTSSALDVVEEIIPEGPSVSVFSDNFPKEYSLSRNFPNPFNPSTKIKFTIPQAHSPLLGGLSPLSQRGDQEGFITLKIYDILGKEVATLVNEQKPAGTYTVEFNASNLSSGIYFYQLKTGIYSETKKIIFMK